MENIPSIGFSLNDYSHKASFEHGSRVIASIVSRTLEHGLPEGVCLNVNIPAQNGEKLKGIMITRQARAFWNEDFEERTDPHMRDYYWLRGDFVTLETGEDNDQWAISNNYVSIVPIQIDLTAYHMIDKIKNWKIEF
jgi:5'-nucleotidase